MRRGRWQKVRVSGSGTTGRGVLRATLRLAKEGVPRLRFPSDLGVPPHITGTLLKMGGSTPTQERINNEFMTFNKTQTSPHWRLIKASALSTQGRRVQEKGGRRGVAFTLRDWVGSEDGEGWGPRSGKERPPFKPRELVRRRRNERQGGRRW